MIKTRSWLPSRAEGSNKDKAGRGLKNPADPKSAHRDTIV